MTWKDIAIIICIYENEILEGNISRYGTAADIEPYSKLILNKYNELTANIN